MAKRPVVVVALGSVGDPTQIRRRSSNATRWDAEDGLPLDEVAFAGELGTVVSAVAFGVGRKVARDVKPEPVV